MPDYKDHLQQAKKNLIILEGLNSKIDDSWDWQVTVAFYTALHFANAHIVKTRNQHYRTHHDMKNALNYEIQINPSKFDEDSYLAYVRLQNLSRRARYLCSDNSNANDDEKAYYISDKFFSKSLRLLSSIVIYFEKKYNEKVSPINIKCAKLNKNELLHFNKIEDSLSK